jgi:heterodisulfide reductase subunit A-like polyferredoxin
MKPFPKLFSPLKNILSDKDMKKTKMKIGRTEVAVTLVHSLVIGSGAAGLNAAVQLRNQALKMY